MSRDRRPSPPSRHLVPWLILAGVLAVWLIETGGNLVRTSHWCHHVYLADAFNHGQLHLFRHPHDAGDMAVVGERVYIVFGPLPALPLMPLVAWLGPRTPDVLVLVLTALFAIFAFDRLLARVHAGSPAAPDRFVRASVTLSFALGTALHYGAPMGNVWLHTQITALALQCWGLWMAAAGRAGWSGVAFGLTLLTRPTLVLALPFALFLLLRREESAAPLPRRALRPALALGIPVVVAALVHAAYNLARFGSPGDAGYHYILMGDVFAKLVETYGRFHVQFLPQNLYGWFLRPPRIEGGALVPDPHGMSLLLAVPFLWLLAVPRRVTAIEWAALATAALIALPALLYYNDGWVQFGQRFALDWIALGLVAASFGAARAPKWAVVTLAVVGIAINAWGMTWFQANYRH